MSRSFPDLGQVIYGITFDHTEVLALLNKLAPAFDRTDLDDALSEFVPADSRPDIGHRVLQNLKRKGVIEFDSDAQEWRKTAQLWRNVPRTLPLKKHPLLDLPTATIPLQELDRLQPPSRLVQLATAGRLGLSAFACFSLIIALITLNASFAWELGREADQFRAAFVVGLMALDLMRPFLIMVGFDLLAKKRRALATVGFCIALMLSPVSILSSTAILSSSFLLGAEMNADAAIQTSTLKSLRGEHTRRLAKAERLQVAWRTECARGGCGPLAAKIEAEFLSAQAEAQVVLDRIVVLTEASNGASDLLARLVLTFEHLGIFGQGRQILLPLFLALSLEVGALFGPALLLQRRAQNAAGQKL